MDKEKFSKILTENGFTIDVIDYLWSTRAKLPDEADIRIMAKATTSEQKAQLVTIAARWKNTQAKS